MRADELANRGRFSAFFSLAVLAAAVAVVAPACSSDSATVQDGAVPAAGGEERMEFGSEDFTYYYGGEEVPLTLWLLKAAVRVDDGKSDALRAYLERDPAVGSPYRTEELGRGIELISLARDLGREQVLQLVEWS